MLASEAQNPVVADADTILVAPPGPSLQTESTIVPVRPEPFGFKMVRSPAASPLSFESAPDRAVIGCPLCSRNPPVHCQPLRKPRAKELLILVFGSSYTQANTN